MILTSVAVAILFVLGSAVLGYVQAGQYGHPRRMRRDFMRVIKASIMVQVITGSLWILLVVLSHGKSRLASVLPALFMAFTILPAVFFQARKRRARQLSRMVDPFLELQKDYPEGG